MRVRALCLFWALISGSCQTNPDLPLRVRRLTTAQIMNASQVILIGTIRSIRVFGPQRTTDAGVKVRGWRIEIEPLLFLKGRSGNGTLTYFMNNFDPNVVQNGDFEWLMKGERRIFFLRSDGEMLRSVVDLYVTSMAFPHTVPTLTNRYPQEYLGQTIARLLLTPIPGATERALTNELPQVTTEALRSAGYAFVAGLLQDLRQSDLPDLRVEACLTAYEQVFSDESCVDKLEASATNADLLRRIRDVRKRRIYLRQICGDAIEAGRDCPLTGYTYAAEPSDRESVREFYNFLSRNSDQVLKACAQTQLARLR